MSEELSDAVESESVPGPEGDPKRGRKRGQSVPRWSAEEESCLRLLVAELGERNWATVTARLGTNRTSAAVDQHWQMPAASQARAGWPWPRSRGCRQASP